MCFENEGEWCAVIDERTEAVAESSCHCDECGREIEAGEVIRKIFQQEEEECQCGHCQFPANDGECSEDFGHVYRAVVCSGCCKLLEAIEKYEEKEGCPKWARQPNPGDLWESLWEHDQRFEYVELAVDLFPELWDHKIVVHLLENA